MDLDVKTERLLLRPYRDEDAPAIESLANNWNVARMLGRMPYPYKPGMAAEFMAALAARRDLGTDYGFAITREGAFLGGIGLHRQGEGALLPDGEMELGYWLGEPFWGQGYGSEAGKAMLAFGFGTLGLSSILAGHFEENPASARVLAKLGFRYIGRTMRHSVARGCAVPSLEMAIARSEWTGP